MAVSPNYLNLAMYSGAGAFKNNNIYTGSFTISGSTTGGTNTQTTIVNLSSNPDIIDIQFNGPANGNTSVDPRPATAWFKNSDSYSETNRVWVPTNNAGGGNPSGWAVYGTAVGSVLTITAVYVQEFTTSETLTSTSVSYRLVDYSVF